MQRKHRNNELRNTKTVAGELRALDFEEGIVAGDYILMALPQGAIVQQVIVLNDNGTDAVGATVVINEEEEIASLAPETNKALVEILTDPIYITAPTAVKVTTDADLEYGRLLVGITYIELDVVNGDRVEAKDD